MQKKFIKNYKLVPDRIGLERRKEIFGNISNNGTYLPRGIEIEDMDKAFFESIEQDFEIVIEGEKVPVFFMNSQRWGEFAKTFDFTNEFKSLKIPFISVVRNPDIQPGNNQAGYWNIAQGDKTYCYMKVPTFDGNIEGFDTYKIPQPTSVDINYEVRLFSDRMSELNKLHKVVHLLFQSRQHYINVKGHPMPTILEGISDESTMSDFENRRFYVQKYDMTLMGYLLNESDFEVIPSINRSMITTEIINKRNGTAIEKFLNVNVTPDNDIEYSIFFKNDSNNQFSFTSDSNLNLIRILDVKNILTILIFINNVEVFNGLQINNQLEIKDGDEVTISVSKNNDTETGSFIIQGKII